jgi:hypothetical protein
MKSSLVYLCCFFFIGLFAPTSVVAQKDYTYLYTVSRPKNMEKEDYKAEKAQNKANWEAYQADPNMLSTLDSVQLTNFFYYVKVYTPYWLTIYTNEDCLKYRKALFPIALYILKNNAGTWQARYAALDFLQQMIDKDNIPGKSDSDYATGQTTIEKKVIDDLINGERYGINDRIVDNYFGGGPNYSRLFDKGEIDREKHFFKFIMNPDSLPTETLESYFKEFNESDQAIRTIHVWLTLMKRKGVTEKEAIDLVSTLDRMSPICGKFIATQFKKEWDMVLSAMQNNAPFMKEYVYYVFNNVDQNEAVSIAQKAAQTEDIKFFLVAAKNIMEGLQPSVRLALSMGFDVETNYKIMFKFSYEQSGQDCLELMRMLDKEYSAALDSIDITAIPGFYYSNDGSVVGGGDQMAALENKKDFFEAMSIYRKYGFDLEADYLEVKYWYAQNLTVAEIEKNVANGSLKSEIASSILLYYGQYCVEEKANGSRNREMLMNECIPTLNKAAKYDPNNAYVYKSLGDAYSFYGNGTKAQSYYEKANNMGANMSDRVSGGGKGRSIKTGKRGGKYYINGNGNKTYVKP